jgi:hypothetical protein
MTALLYLIAKAILAFGLMIVILAIFSSPPRSGPSNPGHRDRTPSA